MNIGKNIKQLRIEKGISQKEFARILNNMPVSTLANYENNHREPNIETLTKIATALGVSINDLIEKISFEGETLEEITSQINRNKLISETNKEHLIDILQPQIKVHQTPREISDERALICVEELLDYAKCNFSRDTNDLIAIKNAVCITLKLKVEELKNERTIVKEHLNITLK
ncbi:helix-turn-helix domain-containing protein [Clostridium algoriphilum]|uniref:helix-turn-helix domain-containing protein n=1 Tax=Clostridium algoriphilum TaxID=198347 RepID=UPI001CF37D32|nr:helix-turn-helix transcriptional regulator [Clostridium algoriphilum]MCB2295818.1 helix-turn-helix domain-containing protein [Clostridium algoriphilum]